MSLLSFSHSSFRPLTGRSLRQVVAAAFHHVLQEADYRRASNELHLLHDDVLQDIGVARGDIETAVRHGRSGLAS